MRRSFLAISMLITSMSASHAAQFVLNGSFESGAFSNTNCNYMALSAGSTAINNWKVSAGTTGQLVWAQTLTCDGHSASSGTYFADLSGFGSNSPNGTLEQTLAGLIVGQSYAFSIDSIGALPGITVGGIGVALSQSNSFVVGNDTWLTEIGNFIAGASNPLLQIANITPTQQIIFVDNVSVNGPARTTGVPEPITLSLFGAGIAGTVAMRRRKKKSG